MCAPRHVRRWPAPMLGRDVVGDLTNEWLSHEVDDESNHHADAGHREARVERADRVLRQPTADERREERPEVDAHVEDRVGAIEPAIARRVESAHLRRHVRLEEAVAEDEEDEGGQKDRILLERHEEVADRHEQGADDDGSSISEDPVREEAAEDRRDVDEARVDLVDGPRIAARHLEVIHHVEDEERPHPVVAEPLPHLRQEENVKTEGMTEEGSLLDDGAHEGATSWEPRRRARMRLMFPPGFRKSTRNLRGPQQGNRLFRGASFPVRLSAEPTAVRRSDRGPHGAASKLTRASWEARSHDCRIY